MTWWAIMGMAVITFLNRYAFLAESVRYEPGIKVRRFLSYSSYSVLTAIWTPIVFNMDANGAFSYSGGDYLLAASVAAVLSFLRVPSILVVLLSTFVFFAVRFI